ncbi:hypothetical protein AT251_23920 [Enterovibrio nigricans]|nr:hypothetical protein AT251_23920 [Enterovibrio nigricans]
MGVADQIVASRFSSIDLSNKAPQSLILDASVAHVDRKRKRHFDWIAKRSTRRTEILKAKNIHWTGEVS